MIKPGGIKDLTKLAETGGKIVDDVHLSGEEQAGFINQRHATDMASDNKLSKSIRPITLIWLLSLETLIIVVEALGATIPSDTKIQVGVLLGGAFGFYFYSKRHERVAEHNAKANVAIEKERTKAELRKERKDNRLRRKLIKKGLLSPEELEDTNEEH